MRNLCLAMHLRAVLDLSYTAIRWPTPGSRARLAVVQLSAMRVHQRSRLEAIPEIGSLSKEFNRM